MSRQRGKFSWLAVLAACISLGALGLGQTQSLPDAPTPQNNKPAEQSPLPDAPSSTPAAPPVFGGSSGNSPSPPETPVGSPPSPPSSSETETGATPGPAYSSRNQMFTLTRQVNFVVVPVTVKDSSGHLVEGLLQNDFSVYEDGQRQKLTFFTSDPFPLSAVVVIDLGLPDKEFSKVKETLSALAGAFSQFDEIAVYTYGNTVAKSSDFTTLDELSTVFKRLRTQHGRTGGVPVIGGPFGSGPTINNRPVDPTVPPVQTPITESRVMNDAILAAAQDLAKRESTRRKIIFVISDGREIGSSASYADVLKVLLSRQITVYGVGVASIPGYDKLQRFHIPGLGYGNILPKYASATGGDVFTEISPSAIETAYARVTEQARNQYTLGYTTRATPSSTYRSIEVRVRGRNLKVYAKDGYYPLPPGI